MLLHPSNGLDNANKSHKLAKYAQMSTLLHLIPLIKIGGSCHINVKITKKCGALTLQQTRDLKLRMSQVKPLDYWKNNCFQVAR